MTYVESQHTEIFAFELSHFSVSISGHLFNIANLIFVNPTLKRHRLTFF